MSTPAVATRATVTLNVPGILPASGNTDAYVFGSPLAEAASELRAAFFEQLPDDSPLRQESRLEARATISFTDRRHRVVGNFEAVVRCVLEAALEDAGRGARDVDLHVQIRGGAARLGSTAIELGGVR